MNPLTFLANPFQWVLEQLTAVFTHAGPLAAIGSFGIAVMVLTIVIRALLFPVFGWQLRTSRRIQREQRLVAPQLQELRKKYKGQPQKLSAEMNKVYREHGISPFSGLTGCVPAIVQMPVLFSLYLAIRSATGHLGMGEKGFLWISDVSQSAQQACCQVAGTAQTNWGMLVAHPTVLILPLLAGALTFVQSRMMMPPPRPDMSDQERSMANISRQMTFLFPVMIFFFGLFFPQGLAIYWVTGSIFMVLQQYYVVGWGGMKVPPWMPGANRETPLSYPKTQPATALVSANGSKKTARKVKPAADDTSADEGDADSQPAPKASASRPEAKPPQRAVRTGALPGVRTPPRPSQRNRRRRRR